MMWIAIVWLGCLVVCVEMMLGAVDVVDDYDPDSNITMPGGMAED
jgi:hypothetical protein